MIKENRNKKFVCTHSNRTQYDFTQYRDINQFGKDIYSDELSIEDPKNQQYDMEILINKVKGYGATNPKKYIKSTQEVLDNVEKLWKIRNEIVNAFENKFFTKQSDMSRSKDEDSTKEPDMLKLECGKKNNLKKKAKNL